jgi:NAD(P)-dependent dehydrogenase (short-subunit alcohol dehydrogenase family)
MAATADRPTAAMAAATTARRPQPATAAPAGRRAARQGGQKVALVTGASSGIGAAIAHRLAADGYGVFGTSRRATDTTVDGIEMIPLDVTADASVAACAAIVLERAGRIDVLVNNAGYLLGGAVEEVSLDQAKAQFETNFFGAFRVIKAFLPAMRAAGSGRIVNVTSLAGLVPLPFWGLYNASKFALEGLTETLRYEVKSFGISVSAIEAGLIKTRLYTDDHVATAIAAYESQHRRFLKKLGEFEAKGPGPEVVAAVVAKAVAAAKPKPRYRITREATQFTTLRRLLPSALFEKGLRSAFKLDDVKY